MYHPNEILARKNIGSGDTNQCAASNEVPAVDVVIHYREPDVSARTSCLGVHQSIRATCRYPENRKKGSTTPKLHKESDLHYSETRALKPADPCLKGPGFDCIHRTAKAMCQRFKCIFNKTF